MQHIWLFEYGQLQTRGRPYDTALRGEMRMRTRRDPAARFGPDYAGKVYGQVHAVTQAQLRSLRRIERPQYALTRVATWRGQPLYAFVDMETDWENEPIVASGKWRP